MAEGSIRWYVLFANYEQALALRDLLLEEHIPNRLAPAPRAIQGELSCGVSLLLEPEWVDPARACMDRHHAAYHSVVPLEGQLRARRDQYC